MATKIVPQTTEPPQPIESTEQRETRIRREMVLITKAHAEIDAGLGIGDDDVEAWLDQLDLGKSSFQATGLSIRSARTPATAPRPATFVS